MIRRRQGMTGKTNVIETAKELVLFLRGWHEARLSSFHSFFVACDMPGVKKVKGGSLWLCLFTGLPRVPGGTGLLSYGVGARLHH
jgi:hypothetical protein